MKEKSEEKPLELVSKMLSEKFDMVDPLLERAHRDGKKVGARSRHMLVKVLSYQDKCAILKQQLEDCDYFITDDLTKADLVEKRKHKEEVQVLARAWDKTVGNDYLQVHTVQGPRVVKIQNSIYTFPV